MKERSNESWRNVYKIILPHLLISGIFLFLGGLLLGIDPYDFNSFRSDSGRLILNFLLMTGTFVTVSVFRRYIDKHDFASLGLANFLTLDVFLGLIIGVTMIVLGYALLLYHNEITYIRSSLIGAKLFLGLISYLFVAFSEELLFRGYMLTNLMASMNKYVALMTSSFIFSLFHCINDSYGIVPSLVLFLAGILLGLSYIFTKNLWFPIALHFSWNFFQGTIFGFNVSGNNSYSVIQQVPSANTLLNGGSFGFEGSIIAVILHLVFIPIIFQLFKDRKVTKLN